jgi:hypothetical protein
MARAPTTSDAFNAIAEPQRRELVQVERRATIETDCSGTQGLGTELGGQGQPL